MNGRILYKYMDDKVPVQVNSKTKKCIIKDIDDIGILVEFYKYNDKDLVYYPFTAITQIKPVLMED